MKTSFVLATAVGLASAFPGMAGINMKEEGMKMLKERHDAEQQEKRQLGDVLDGVGDLVGGLLDDVKGLLGSVASAVDPDNKRPEPGYEFQAPKKGDSRGPCPALNTLANHGYLPRDGYVSFDQILEATARGFNMGADLATVLGVFTTLTDANITEQSWYLGSSPEHLGGLNRHDTVEADISPNREDYYLGCGDNHHLSSRLFKQNVALAAQNPSKEFDFETMGNQFAMNADFSLKNNPFIYYFPFPSIVSVVAYNFYPQFFSNGTFGAGGVANYESISSILGAKLNKKTGEFQYVPERFPDNWYRRATPYGAVQALTEGFTGIYPYNPVPMPIPQIGTDNFSPQTLLCDIYNGINSITPLALGGALEQTGDTISWAVQKLIDVGLDATTLGCPKNSISPNFKLYPNKKQKGGPLRLPRSQYRWTGSNKYNRVYFTEAPTQPMCKHVSKP
ncbi:uncharacterized protein LTR77_003897 [Saxophila tyrrhenica]|uniref:Heme haloperoxidase family profile domain-containing protein n=1 Tax=Saxophila tyrrhenica TaxID=1690608 RepID=A0AAV9PIF8_9PEZI|nr:hypothetical protein LTR77_003897 [Saxophila tyrrhenica]